ncbi:MAG: TetR/AcrR family transcriptional regulator [Dehalococcoidia bacterium]|nr:TetR/AcrR family transcriptional regulator [Dehalococcoidia bacterium]
MVEKKENTAFRQKQIAVAAAELITGYGSNHVTIKQLAAHINLSEAAIYRHFKSKSDIFRFLLKHIEITLLTELYMNNLNKKVNSFDLDTAIDRHISSIERNRGMSFHVIAEIISMGDTTLNHDSLEIINNYIACMAQIFRKGNIKDADIAATVFFTIVQGMVNLWILSEYTFNLKRRFNKVWVPLKRSLSPI